MRNAFVKRFQCIDTSVVFHLKILVALRDVEEQANLQLANCCLNDLVPSARRLLLVVAQMPSNAVPKSIAKCAPLLRLGRIASIN